MDRKKTPASVIAFGGVMAALAVVIMSLGGLIPVATYVCPMLSMIILEMVRKSCGSRIAWAWYAAVAILCLLLSPDKEAGAVFLFLGYYPIIKPRMDALKLRWLWKGILFNGSVAVLYTLLMKLMGMDYLAEEFMEFGIIGLIVMLAMGNLIFYMMDRLLAMKLGRKR